MAQSLVEAPREFEDDQFAQSQCTRNAMMQIIQDLWIENKSLRKKLEAAYNNAPVEEKIHAELTRVYEDEAVKEKHLVQTKETMDTEEADTQKLFESEEVKAREEVATDIANKTITCVTLGKNDSYESEGGWHVKERKSTSRWKRKQVIKANANANEKKVVRIDCITGKKRPEKHIFDWL